MTSKGETWAEMIAKGTAVTFFDSHQNDEELAVKLNSFIPGSGTITATEIARDRQRFHQMPRRGEPRDEKTASPTKNVILNKAKQLRVEDALAEIIDNVFDNFERNESKPSKLEINIAVYPPLGPSTPGEIVITENSGGVPGDRLLPLIQLGLSDRSVGGIGAWGEGFKIAAFSLGHEIEIFTSFPNERSTAVFFPKGWLDPNHRFWPAWKVEIYDIQSNPPNPGHTVVHVKYLLDKTSEFFGFDDQGITPHSEDACSMLSDYFGEIYAEKYHSLVSKGSDVNIAVSVGPHQKIVSFLKPVEIRLQENLAFLPWLRPIRWTKELVIPPTESGGIAKYLTVTIYAGLSATDDYSQSYLKKLQSPGVEMWGNGRKFSLQGRITDESVGWGHMIGGKVGRNPLSNASSKRIIIVALFRSDDSLNIPWAAPVKNDYNRRSDYYAEIREILGRVISLYKDAPLILDFVLQLFSHSWTQITPARKLGILFNGTDATPEFVAEFSNSRFGKKLLDFKPTLTFKDVDTTVDDPTPHTLFNMVSTKIRSIAEAASATKQSAAQRIEFLKAILPSLSEKALIEEKLGISLDEEVDL
jgi:hypothetical protein